MTRNKVLTSVLVTIGMVALQAVARALVDGTVALPPDWAWLASLAAGIVAMLKTYNPTNQ